MRIGMLARKIPGQLMPFDQKDPGERRLGFIAFVLLFTMLAVPHVEAAPGELTFVEAIFDGVGGVDGLNGATGVAITPDGAHVYVAGLTDNAVAVFSRDAGTGELTFVEAQFNGVGGVSGLGDAHSVAVSPDNAHVYVSAFSDNALAVFSRDIETGELTFVEAHFDGSGGVNGLRRAEPVIVSPDGDHVYVGGLDDNAVAVFSRNAQTGALTFVEAQVEGSEGVSGLIGPESIAMTPDGVHLYVASQNSSAVAVFSRNSSTGALSFVEAYFDNEGGATGLAGADAITASPDGKHVYVASEDDSALTVFSRDDATGLLTLVETHFDGVGGIDGLAGGQSVTVSPDGDHVYAIGFSDDAVVLFDRNASTGALSYVETRFDGVGGVDGLNGAIAVAISQDGKHVYVTGRFDDAVSAFSRTTSPMPGGEGEGEGEGEGPGTREWIFNSATEHYYRLTDPLNWHLARLQAEAWGGYLVTINDSSENDWIMNTSGFADPQHGTLWIGLTDESVEGTWTWTNGENSPYRNWAEGEPNNLGNEDYAEIDIKPFGSVLPGEWNDGRGDYTRRGIVERNSFPATDSEGESAGEGEGEAEGEFTEGEGEIVGGEGESVQEGEGEGEGVDDGEGEDGGEGEGGGEPDLVIDRIVFEGGSETITIRHGELQTLDATVTYTWTAYTKNSGGGNAGDSVTLIGWNESSINCTIPPTDFLMGSSAINALSAGEEDSGPTDASYTWGVKFAGTYALVGRADRDDDVNEGNGESNNVFCATIIVEAGDEGEGGKEETEPIVCNLSALTAQTDVATELHSLRRFRDVHLLSRFFGSSLIRSYYQIGP